MMMVRWSERSNARLREHAQSKSGGDPRLDSLDMEYIFDQTL